MKFVKYTSLTNHYQQKFLDQLIMQGLSEGEFVATEKAHGANFTFITDGQVLRTAKRSGFNGDGENFYGSQQVLEKYAGGIFGIAMRLNEEYGFGKYVTVMVRGEIIGGMFQGKKDTHAKRVQKEVEYCSNNEFVAFGIEVHHKDGSVYHIPYDMFVDLCDSMNIPRCPEMGRGTLQEMLALNNEFNSQIPMLFGNDTFEGNITEGLVIQPTDGARFLYNGSRVIIKSKNTKFAENKGTKVKTKQGTTLSDEAKAEGEELTAYFTEQRISNLISKLGEPTSWKDFPKYGGLFFQDALEDYTSDTDSSLKEHLGDDWKGFVRVYKAISDSALREVFKVML